MQSKLPDEIITRIDLEARQFAFYNYVTPFLHPNAVLERMDTWPWDARVCYYSILHYMSRPDICWPYKEPTLATEYATKLVEAEQMIKNRDDKIVLLMKARKCELESIDNMISLLTEVFQKHESGLLSDRFVYDKIKKFLYGGE